jgi:hypothetical protein
VVAYGGGSALHRACKKGMPVDSIHLLVERGPNLLRIANTSGKTDLHYACKGIVPLETLHNTHHDRSLACPEANVCPGG